MVHYAKQLARAAAEKPEWSKYYVDYKNLKRQIKAHSARIEASTVEEKEGMGRMFSDELDKEIEKTVLFMIEQQGLLAARLQKLREEWARMNPAEDSESPVRLREEYRQVGYDLVKVLRFLRMNAQAIRKILKKFSKQTGIFINEEFILSRTQHPYSQLQQLFRNVGLMAMVGTIARHLDELRTSLQSPCIQRTPSRLSIFQQPCLPAAIAEEEPVMKAIEEEHSLLTRSTSIRSFLANNLLMPAVTEGERREVEYHFPSVMLNQLNTFLYMINYYIIVPSSDDYAEMLKVPSTLCGVIIGSMPVAALVSSVLYSWWSNYSYLSPLVLSTVVLFVGNIMYGAALTFDSVLLCLLGRALCGLGGARAINRRYIADEVPLKKRNSESALFVSVSAFGMACGPAVAGLLKYLDFQAFGVIVNFATAPGWLMALLWLLYLVALLLLFREPERTPQQSPPQETEALLSQSVLASIAEDGRGSLRESLLGNSSRESTPRQTAPPGHNNNNNNNASGRGLLEPEPSSSFSDDDTPQPRRHKRKSMTVETMGDLRSEISGPIAVMLIIYFTVKFACEVLISESAILTKYYFSWSLREVSSFLGLLGLATIPLSTFVGTYISNRFEERVVIVWTEIATGLGVLAILDYKMHKYSLVRYVIASTVIYVSSSVLEAVAGALLSKMMSPRLSRGTFNCGLLSTEAGTLARAIADGMITVCGYFGRANLLNQTMAATLLVVIWCTVSTFRRYYQLF